MKPTVILTLAAALTCLCGCSKKDNAAGGNPPEDTHDCARDDEYYPPRDYSHLGDLSRFDGYYWYRGYQIPVTADKTRWYVIFKSQCSKRILAEFEQCGFEVAEDYGDYYVYTSEGYEVPDELKDCRQLLLYADRDPAESVKGIIYSNWIYTIPPSKEVVGLTNTLIIGVESENLATLDRYAEELGFYLIERFDNPIAIVGACTNRSADNHVRVANWLYNTGDFRYVQPELAAYHIIE